MNYLDYVKPVNNISKIIYHLREKSESHFLSTDQHVHWIVDDISYLYFFDEGEVSIMKKASNILISRVCKQHIFGFAEHFQSGLSQTYLRVDKPTCLYRISAVKALSIIDEKFLWQDVAILLAFHINYLTYRDSRLTHPRAYSTIKNCLEELYFNYDEGIRLKIKVIDYIQERTFLSRSSILNILSALSKGGYISLRNGGYLVSLKKLPNGF